MFWFLVLLLKDRIYCHSFKIFSLSLIFHNYTMMHLDLGFFFIYFHLSYTQIPKRKQMFVVTGLLKSVDLFHWLWKILSHYLFNYCVCIILSFSFWGFNQLYIRPCYWISLIFNPLFIHFIPLSLYAFSWKTFLAYMLFTNSLFSTVYNLLLNIFT